MTDSPTAIAKPAPVSFATALRLWWWLGWISFGGPAGQIAVMHRELVERRRWISEHRFLHALNYCMVLPGPEAQQLATYIGWLLHGWRGGLAAGGLFVLPSVFLLIGLSWAYMAWSSTPLLAGLLYGIKPAVTAIVAQAAWRIGSRALRDPLLWAIAAGSFAAVLAGLPFPLLIALAGLLGYLGGKVAPARFVQRPAHGSGGDGYGPALIDDDTVVAHAAGSRRGLVLTILFGLALWTSAYLALRGALGAANPVVQMAGFFSGAALVTFGGAYAVLPYVFDAAVHRFHWLSTAQMIDGLALGETTPGPLIMVLAFVAYLGGWQTEALGPEHRAAAGALAAVVATYFTFLPSFVFIFAGAPLVEATRGSLRLAAPLSAITAAVVGVILNLALLFAVHVLWPQGYGGRFDWAALLIGVAGQFALTRFKLGVPGLIAASAVAGWLLAAVQN